MKTILIVITALSVTTIISLITAMRTHGSYASLMVGTNLIAMALLIYVVFKPGYDFKQNIGWLIVATLTTSVYPLTFFIAIFTSIL